MGPGMELMTGSFTYNLTNPNRKTATLKYERGNRKINMDMELTLRGSQGNLKVTVVTPFEIIKTLDLDANWGNGRGTVEYFSSCSRLSPCPSRMSTRCTPKRALRPGTAPSGCRRATLAVASVIRPTLSVAALLLCRARVRSMRALIATITSTLSVRRRL